MKHSLLLFCCIIVLPAKAMDQLHRLYCKAFDYSGSGNFHAFKNIVTKHDLEIPPEILIRSVKSTDDIENSKSMVEFCKARGANFNTKNYQGLTILHQAAFSKNVAAIQSVMQNNTLESLYDKDKKGNTVLSLAFKRIHHDPWTTNFASRFAAIAALKKGGYELKKDPLYQESELPKGLLELWDNEGWLDQELQDQKQQMARQQILKNEAREILKEYNATDINIDITNFGEFKRLVSVVHAARYGDVKVIEVDPEFLTIPYKKPVILHALAHHLLKDADNDDLAPAGYDDNDDFPPKRFAFRWFKKTDEEKHINEKDIFDDFAIMNCPEEFIRACTYLSDNYYKSWPRSHKERIARAKEYLKNKPNLRIKDLDYFFK